MATKVLWALEGATDGVRTKRAKSNTKRLLWNVNGIYIQYGGKVLQRLHYVGDLPTNSNNILRKQT